jgi:hypothetical protein
MDSAPQKKFRKNSQLNLTQCLYSERKPENLDTEKCNRRIGIAMRKLQQRKPASQRETEEREETKTELGRFVGLQTLICCLWVFEGLGYQGTRVQILTPNGGVPPIIIPKVSK